MGAGQFTTKPLGLGGNIGFWWNDADSDGTSTPRRPSGSTPPTHAEFPYQLYPFLDSNGDITDEADGGPRRAGSRATPTWPATTGTSTGRIPAAVNYDNLTTFYRSDIDPNAKNVKTSPRTREIIARPRAGAPPRPHRLRQRHLPALRQLRLGQALLSGRHLSLDARPGHRQHADVVRAPPGPSPRRSPSSMTTARSRGIQPGGRRRQDLVPAHRHVPGPDALPDGRQEHGLPDLHRPRPHRHQAAVEPLVPERLGHAPGPARPLERLLSSTRRTSGPSTASPSATGAPARAARRRSRCTPAGWPRSAPSTSCPWASRSRGRSIAREGWKIPNYVTLAYAGNDSLAGPLQDQHRLPPDARRRTACPPSTT